MAGAPRRRAFKLNGPKVREIRERSGLSATELAALVGCHQGHISHIELDGINPSPDLTLKIANALGVAFEDITERITPGPGPEPEAAAS